MHAKPTLASPMKPAEYAMHANPSMTTIWPQNEKEESRECHAMLSFRNIGDPT
jgi:hypothetical protein